jgi:outer membrane lipoprotein LolB
MVSLLAGCAALPERPAVENPRAVWQERQANLTRLDSWELRGRLALRAGDEGGHASVNWVHERATDRIDLAGPFGGGRVRVTRDAGGASLRDANGKLYLDVSMQELVARNTGWMLPLEGMNYWVLGVPQPGAPARETLDEFGRLKALAQLGWEINFLEYNEQGAVELPRRIFMQRTGDASTASVLEVRLVIERWTLGSAAPLARADRAVARAATTPLP